MSSTPPPSAAARKTSPAIMSRFADSMIQVRSPLWKRIRWAAEGAIRHAAEIAVATSVR
jgi:hypothetical protein